MPGKIHLGGRVLKTALAVGISVYIVQNLGYERVTLTAIVALVTIQRTFYGSLKQGAARLGSVILGALLGTFFALLLGGTPLAFGLAILTVIVVSIRLNWQDNIVIVAVVAIGVISSQAENLFLYSMQQFISALIGAVVALSINILFAPTYQPDVHNKLRSIETSLSQMLGIVAAEMHYPDLNSDISGQVEQLEAEIRSGLQISKLFREEQRFNPHSETQADRYLDTLRVFTAQTEILLEMHKLARRMTIEVPQSQPIAKLLRIMGYVQKRRLYGKNTHFCLIDIVIANLEGTFAHMELPATRDEFISRSSLVHMFREVKKYYKQIQMMPAALQNEATDDQQIAKKGKDSR
ncbi:MAG: aromatic acid exporter family protein [Bacillota bacterium]|nr:aromatic acid exporter family protein [Bacillota bacterium]MDW7683871.1 aromatic acid exporter family protein [Bacillota bacterium]